MSNTYLGVIPARGGSKRVPRKNIRMLGEHPLIYYSIKAAKDSKYLDAICFTSEDPEILNVASRYLDSDEIIRRPLEYSLDHIRNTETLKHAIKSAAQKPTHLILLQPTSPFRTGDDIDSAIKIFELSNCKTLASVSPAVLKRDNVLKRRINDIDCCDLIHSETPYEFLRYNAAIYIVEVDYLMNQNLFKDDLQAYYEMTELNSLDIDTELDLKIANFLMGNRCAKN